MRNYFCEDICYIIFGYIFDPFEYLRTIQKYNSNPNCILTYDKHEYELISRCVRNVSRTITFHNLPMKTISDKLTDKTFLNKSRQ